MRAGRLCKVYYYNSTCQRWRYGGQGRRLLSVEIFMMIVLTSSAHVNTSMHVWRRCMALLPCLRPDQLMIPPVAQWAVSSASAARAEFAEPRRAPCVLSRCSPSGYIREGPMGNGCRPPWLPPPPALFPYSTHLSSPCCTCALRQSRAPNEWPDDIYRHLGKKLPLVSCDFIR